MLKIVVELPYDVGFPHKLRVGSETAVISSKVAEILHFKYGVPWTNGGRLYVNEVDDLAGAKAAGIEMSKKAARLMAKATAMAEKP